MVGFMSYDLISSIRNFGISDSPVNPSASKAVTVLITCSIQGLKQHIFVEMSVYRFRIVLAYTFLTKKTKKGNKQKLTRKAFRAWGIASQGAGKSKNTKCPKKNKNEILRNTKKKQKLGLVTSSSTSDLNPILTSIYIYSVLPKAFFTNISMFQLDSISQAM